MAAVTGKMVIRTWTKQMEGPMKWLQPLKSVHGSGPGVVTSVKGLFLRCEHKLQLCSLTLDDIDTCNMRKLPLVDVLTATVHSLHIFL